MRRAQKKSQNRHEDSDVVDYDRHDEDSQDTSLEQTDKWQRNAELWLELGLHPTQRTQRKERSQMTSLLDRPIRAASDDGVYAAGTLPSCGRHAIKYEIIEIKFDLHHKLHNKQRNLLKFGRLILFF